MLTNNLMKNFIKTMAPSTKPSTINSIYGTLNVSNGEMHVQLDGSQEETPVISTVTGESGDRVTVAIKDHVAIVTGNLTEPAINERDLDNVFPSYTEAIMRDVERITGAIDDRITSFEATSEQRFEEYDGYIGSIMETTGNLQTELGTKVDFEMYNELAQTAGANYSKITAVEKVLGVSEKDGETVSTVVTRVNEVYQDLGSFKTTVSTTYAKEEDLEQYAKKDSLKDYITYNDAGKFVSIDVLKDYALTSSLNLYATKEEYTSLESRVEQTEGKIVSEVEAQITGKGFLVKGDLSKYAEKDELKNYATTTYVGELKTQVEQTESSITSKVQAAITAQNLATKNDVTSMAESVIEQTESSITSKVQAEISGQDLATKKEVTTMVNSVIDQTETSITSKVQSEIVTQNLATKKEATAIAESVIEQKTDSIVLSVTNSTTVKNIKDTADAAKTTADAAAAKVTRDAIISLINSNKGSQVRISADNIVLDGTLSGKDADGNLWDMMSFYKFEDVVQLRIIRNAYFSNLVDVSGDIMARNGITLGGVRRTTWPTASTTTGLTSSDFDFRGQTNTGSVSVPGNSSKELEYTFSKECRSNYSYMLSIISISDYRIVCTGYERKTKSITFTLENKTSSAISVSLRFQLLGFYNP